jgi:dihydropteroate synthase
MKAKIMAIGNVTPDSFYPASRLTNSEQLEVWAHNALEDGADILDLGGCSTRPGSTPVDQEEEWRRVEPALNILKHKFPETQLSLDTFRPEIARRALDQFGPMIINDISGGCETMYDLVRYHDVPYVFTFRGDYSKLKILDHCRGIQWVLDPGFGFIGSTEADYECMRKMDQLRAYNYPVLVGLSRKSIVWRPLGLTPETSLPATQALQMYALEHGATIIRTHDVRETAQTIKLFELCNS